MKAGENLETLQKLLADSSLKLIRELLADDSSLYVHIDCKIGHYVKVLLDGILGPAKFRMVTR